MLAAALRGHVGNRALEDLEQRLLHALAAYVAGDGHVFALAGDLVDFVNIDDAALRRADIAVGRLNQAQQDIFNILAHIAGFGQRRGVGNGKGHVQDARQRLGQIGLAAAGGANHEDVGFLQFHIPGLLGGVDAFIVVIYGHAQRALGLVLPDHILIQHGLHFGGQRQGGRIGRGGAHGGYVVGNDIIAQLDALIADVYIGAGYQTAYLILRFVAEAAPMQPARGEFILGHGSPQAFFLRG